MRNEIETALGPKVDEEIEKQSMKGLNNTSGQETLVQMVANTVQESEM